MKRYEATGEKDGLWTDKEHPGDEVHRIEGQKITIRGVTREMVPVGNGTDVVVLEKKVKLANQLFTSAGELVLPSSGHTGGPGRELVWSNGSVWLDVRDCLRDFDGLWTPQLTPGIRIYNIFRGVIALNDGLTRAKLLPAGKDSFSTVFQGLPMRGTISSAHDKILLDSGITLIPFVQPGSNEATDLSRLDGKWTNEAHPGQQIFDIKDGKIDWDGRATSDLKAGTDGRFSTQAANHTLIGKLVNAVKIEWGFGDVWVPLPSGYQRGDGPRPIAEGAYCFDDHIVYVPMDMDDQPLTREPDAFACQRRCQRHEGCIHFAYWNLGGHCHLQDAYATKSELMVGFTSGPFKCWSKLEDPSKFSVHGDRTYLPKWMSCLRRATQYVPAIAQYTKTFPKEDFPDDASAIAACQKYCANLPVCGFFSMNFAGRICQISPPTALPSSRIVKTFGGPKECHAEDVKRPDKMPDFLIEVTHGEKGHKKPNKTEGSATVVASVRKFRDAPLPELLSVRSGWTAMAGGLLCCGMLTAAVLLAWRHRVRPAARSRRNLGAFAQLLRDDRALDLALGVAE